jgi:large subunit ribosomal protein L21
MSKKYAIIQLGGKQFKITEGLEFRVERQDKLKIDVLLYSDGKKVEIGEPMVSGVPVKAKIVGEEKAPKITVARFKSKSRYRKKKGHKQPMSVVKIESIGVGTVKKAPTAKKATPKAKSVEKETVGKEVKKKGSKK